MLRDARASANSDLALHWKEDDSAKGTYPGDRFLLVTGEPEAFRRWVKEEMETCPGWGLSPELHGGAADWWVVQSFFFFSFL